LAGCGCLLLLCCVVVFGAIGFDRMNLYCQPPLILFLQPWVTAHHKSEKSNKCPINGKPQVKTGVFNILEGM
jgi:hypothetical protein